MKIELTNGSHGVIFSTDYIPVHVHVSLEQKKVGCFPLQYSANSHLMHTQCSSNAHLQGEYRIPKMKFKHFSRTFQAPEW